MGKQAIVAGITIIMGLVVGYLILKNTLQKNSTSAQLYQSQQVIPVATNTQALSDIQKNLQEKKVYSFGELSFEYPASLTLSKKEAVVILSHGVPHTHPDFCDGTGLAPEEKILIDFYVTIKIVNAGPNETAEQNNVHLEDATYSKIGPYHTFRTEMGAEGCGVSTYYLLVSGDKTIIITKSYVPLLNPISTTYAENLKLPGIIPPEESDILFTKLIGSLSVKGRTVSASIEDLLNDERDFTASPTEGKAPLTVSFFGLGVTFLDYGDESSCADLGGVEDRPKEICRKKDRKLKPHTYTKPGVYAVIAAKSLPNMILGTTTIIVK